MSLTEGRFSKFFFLILLPVSSLYFQYAAEMWSLLSPCHIGHFWICYSYMHLVCWVWDKLYSTASAVLIGCSLVQASQKFQGFWNWSSTSQIASLSSFFGILTLTLPLGIQSCMIPSVLGLWLQLRLHLTDGFSGTFFKNSRPDTQYQASDALHSLFMPSKPVVPGWILYIVKLSCKPLIFWIIATVCWSRVISKMLISVNHGCFVFAPAVQN